MHHVSPLSTEFLVNGLTYTLTFVGRIVSDGRDIMGSVQVTERTMHIRRGMSQMDTCLALNDLLCAAWTHELSFAPPLVPVQGKVS